jgi:hypothetical protein
MSEEDSLSKEDIRYENIFPNSSPTSLMNNNENIFTRNMPPSAMRNHNDNSSLAERRMLRISEIALPDTNSIHSPSLTGQKKTNINANELYGGVKDETIALEIQRIFDENEINDLYSLLKKRNCLNNLNLVLIYIFHLVQTTGILVTTIASGYGDTSLIWLGVSLNALASLIHVIEKNNNSIMKKMMTDIKKIKAGNYVDETPVFGGDDSVYTKHTPK